jgi:hypothetical protein
MVQTVGTTQPRRAENDGQAPLIVVSSDSHVGPRLTEDLRRYCPSEFLSDFDQFTAANSDAWAQTRDSRVGIEDDETQGASTQVAAEAMQREVINSRTAGHYDVHARLKDMDWDGVAAEVIFHGSQNQEAFPFAGIREARITPACRVSDIQPMAV